jgi:polyhydroxybutyrate depolymerase
MKVLTSSLLLACAAVASAAPLTLTWTIDGVQRQALVYAPVPTAAAVRAPVIFGFHGHGGTTNTASMAMHFQTVWPQAVVVYMQGIPTPSHVDPSGLRSGWQSEPGQVGDRDLKFFDAVLATIKQRFAVDDKRVYATGFSNGAIFSLLLWAERGKELAGIGVCAGVLLPTVHPTTPRPLIHIAGERDPIAKYSLQLATMKQERQINACSEDGHPLGFGATLYPSTKHAPVETVIHRAGHVYPPNASLWMVEFFKGHAAQ